MTTKESNKDFFYDIAEHYSDRLLMCLEEIHFTIPEFFVLNFMCDMGASLVQKDLIRISSRRKPRLFHTPTDNEIEHAISNLLIIGHLVEIDDFHIETINRLLDMCKIVNRGFLPRVGEIDVTPRGFSVYRYWSEQVFEQGYLNKHDSVAIHEGDAIVRGCAASPEQLSYDMTYSHSLKNRYFFDLNEIMYCGQWCRKWWKIIPKGYSCEVSCSACPVPVQPMTVPVQPATDAPKTEVETPKPGQK